VTSIIALLANRGTQRATEQSGSASAYKTLSETVANLSNELDDLRRTLTLKDAYTVYLIDGIREHYDWKPLSFFKWQQQSNGQASNR